MVQQGSFPTHASKVPAVTLGFWIAKIFATTLGETGGDAVSMSWLGETTAQAGQSGSNGYLVGTTIFGVALAVLVALQMRANTTRSLYWLTIIASTTAGTTLADFATRSLGIGYTGGSAAPARAGAGLAWRRGGRRGQGQLEPCRQRPRRAVLLDHHHLLADAGHRARRLGGGPGAGSAISAARRCSAG